MSRGNQALGFAIRAVNESNAALQDARGDLEKLEQTARGVDQRGVRPERGVRDAFEDGEGD